MSGQSLDSVQVHQQADRPASLQGHAHAQPKGIHVAMGESHHLPHEAWHVVQHGPGVIPAVGK